MSRILKWLECKRLAVNLHFMCFTTLLVFLAEGQARQSSKGEVLQKPYLLLLVERAARALVRLA